MRQENPHDVMLAEGVAALVARDADFARIVDQAGPPPSRQREPGFGALLRIIVGQQVSSKAADALWRRTISIFDPLTPDAVAAASDEALCSCGLSRQKMAYARGLAAEIAAQRLDLDALHAMDDADAVAALTRIKGIGPWSAEIYLLFALGRADIWPIGDLAVQIAVKRLKRMRKPPSPERMRKIGEAWRPWRSAAAMLLWHYYAKLPRD